MSGSSLGSAAIVKFIRLLPSTPTAKWGLSLLPTDNISDVEPETLSEPVIWVSVLICNPLSGEIDAVALPLAILDKFNPVIPDAGILVKPDPSPWKLPLNDPLNIPSPLWANEAVSA